MSDGNGSTRKTDFDVVVVGAGFAGLYLLHRLRGLGLSAKAFESGADVGGTWYWNRYPGARCDVPSVDYSYTFDPELEEEWQWSEKYATQPEILSYLQHVADKHDLRRDVQFSTRVDAAKWDEAAGVWRITTDQGDDVAARYYVMATGCLSMPKNLDIEGVERFGGTTLYTSSWPHDGADLEGKRVAVIGTGSSGIQSIPRIAEQAGELTVFQRTPNFSIPAHNGDIPERKREAMEGRLAEYREEARWSRGGVPYPEAELGTFDVTEEEREARFEEMWELGELFAVLGAFTDTMVTVEANNEAAEFIRNKIRSIVDDPETAETLCPDDHPVGTKRPCLDTDYFQTYNLPHVRLVDIRTSPIETITETGIDFGGESAEFDVIVFATGFDAMTGAIVAVDITGRDGVSLAEKWEDGPKTYLGLSIAGFPNFFTITGPGSPSVLSNMAVSIEQHVDWVADCIGNLDEKQVRAIEPSAVAEAGWVQHVNDAGDITLYPQANSWYMGANVPGKPRVFLPYVGGVGPYRAICDEVTEQEYLGFELTKADGSVRRSDELIRRLQPDVFMLLEAMAEMDVPPIESMTPDEARAFMLESAEINPPGPAVGEVVDGVLPGPAGDLDYRLYRPDSPGPHPVVAYFHGGGWVLGSHESDDPFCRDLCVRSEAVVISIDYRHAPEDRFPAAADDASAAVQWVGANMVELGGIPGQLVVAGWSAGGNVAAVACRQARDAGGPEIAGQLLITPVTDCDLTRASYSENADGYVLTTPLMEWFWNHYADEADRTDPKASPLRADDLSNLPPAVVVTSEFDPLRDEGQAYAEAMAAAGVPVTQIQCRGHLHTSLTAVGVILSGAEIRAQMADGIRSFVAAAVPA